MKINKLNLISFGKFKSKELKLKDGLNIIYGKNEAGKSTISAFIRFMLYSMPKEKVSKNNPVPEKEKFLPWNGEVIEGTMEAEDENKSILISRTQRKTGTVKVINSTTGEELKEYAGIEPGSLLLGADSETFERTAFIRQNELEVSTSAELESRLRNLVSGGEEDISYNDAKVKLEAAIRKIDRPNSGILAQTQNQLTELDEKLLLAKSRYEKWQEIGEGISLLYQKRDALEENITKLQQRYDGQNGYAAAQKLEKISACDASLKEYKERLSIIESELDKNGVIPDESFLREVKRLIQDLRILTEKVRLCKEDVKAETLRIEERNIQLEKFSKIVGNEEKIIGNIKKASKTRNRVLLFIGVFLITAMFLSLFGTFFGLFLDLVMLIIGCACGVGGLVLMIIYLSTKGKARADRMASAYGFSSAGELLSQIEELKTIQREISILNDQFNRVKEREKNDAESLNEVKNQLDKMGKMRGINSLTLSGAELMCGDIETLLSRRQTNLSNIELFEGKKAALLEGTSIEELEALSQKAFSQPDALSTGELFEQIKYEREKQKELLLNINSLEYKQQNILKSGETPDEIMTEILSVKEKKANVLKNRTALQLSLNALNKAFERISIVFAPKLCSDACEIFNTMSDSSRELFVDSANNVKIGEDGRIKELAYFSTGTRDAAYISVRLAICGLIYKDKKPPVIFDDTFAHFDIERLKNAIVLLKELAKDRQIILFTCRDEEKNLCRDFANVIEL